jgi:hypothetical protein
MQPEAIEEKPSTTSEMGDAPIRKLNRWEQLTKCTTEPEEKDSSIQHHAKILA